MKLPMKGRGVLITLSDKDKPQNVSVAKKFKELSFKILATSGTQEYLANQEIEANKIFQ